MCVYLCVLVQFRGFDEPLLTKTQHMSCTWCRVWGMGFIILTSSPQWLHIHTPTLTHSHTRSNIRTYDPVHTSRGIPCHSYTQATHTRLSTNTHSAPFRPWPLEWMEICLPFTFFPCCSGQRMCEGVLMDTHDTGPLCVCKRCDFFLCLGVNE